MDLKEVKLKIAADLIKIISNLEKDKESHKRTIKQYAGLQRQTKSDLDYYKTLLNQIEKKL
jgi:hypothetical protein